MNYDSKILDHENSSSPISDTTSNFEYTFSLNSQKNRSILGCLWI